VIANAVNKVLGEVRGEGGNRVRNQSVYGEGILKGL